MATMTVGRDMQSTIRLMDDMMELPVQLQDDMLLAEAQVVYREQHKAALDLDEMGHSTGTTAASLTIGKPTGAKGRSVSLTFKGSRGKGKAKRSNSTVAFFNEVGSKRVRARKWVKQANERCADEAVGAAAKVYEQWLRSRGQ